ncbi:MAG: FKBP-type peptidyl-prolyl cis-trans isomerase [Gemmatimonadota bacterium]
MRYPTLMFLAAALCSASGCSPKAPEKQTPQVPANQIQTPTMTQDTRDPSTLTYAPALNVQIDKMTRTPSGLYYFDRVVGTGALAEKGKKVFMGYVGSMPDGRVFDQSGPGTPYPVVLGRGAVIAGWDEGIIGMKVGGKRLLVVPPLLAYGNASPGAGIPPNATLVFEVSLEKVE